MAYASRRAWSGDVPSDEPGAQQPRAPAPRAVPSTSSTVLRRGGSWRRSGGTRPMSVEEPSWAEIGGGGEQRSRSGMRPMPAQATDDKVGTVQTSDNGWRTGSGTIGVTQLALSHGLPLALRAAWYGGGDHRPGYGMESGANEALIPGRWAGQYAETTRGYQEDRHGGEYLKTLQNTKPIPMWWRYNGKTPPPWFQPNEPLQRAHLMRSPLPVPAPPFRSPFNPTWLNAKQPTPPQPSEFPYKHPMAMPWGGEASNSCPCPGNPALMCDCLSIQYPVALPVPEITEMDGKRMDMGRKLDRQTRIIVDMLLQPPLLENVLGIVFGILLNGFSTGSTRKFPANFVKAQQGVTGLPIALLVGLGSWLVISLIINQLAVF